MTHRPVQRLVAFALVVALSLVVGMGVVGRMETAAVAVVGMCALALCVAYPQFGVAALVVSGFSIEWMVASGFLPRTAQILQDLLAIALLAVIVVRSRRSGTGAFFMVAGRWVLLFAACGLAGAVVAGLHPVAVIMGLRSWVVFVPLALIPHGLRFDEEQLRRLLVLVLGLSVFQVPVAILQFLFLRTGSSGDAVGGTLGVYSSGVLTVLMIATTAFFIGRMIHRHGSAAKAGLALALCMVPPALNETKVFFVAAPTILSVLFLPRVQKSAARAFVILVMVVLAFVLVFQSYQSLYGQTFEGQDVVERLVLQETGDELAEGGVMKRLPSIIFAANEISDRPATLLFGHGAGSLTRSDLVGMQGALLELYGSSLRSTVWLTRLLLEYGFLGLLAFMGLLVSVYRAARRVERESTEAVWRAFGVGMQGAVLTMAVMSVYTGTFTTDGLNCAFWAYAGITGRLVALRASALSDGSGGALESGQEESGLSAPRVGGDEVIAARAGA